MADWRTSNENREDIEHYANAPIVEATLELNLQQLGVEALPKIEALAGELGDYPVKAAVYQFVGQFTVGQVPATQQGATSQQQIVGYAFSSQQAAATVRCSLSSWAYTKFAPYADWPTFTTEARRLWEKFKVLFDNVTVSQVGIRFVNDFALPVGEPIEKYVQTYIEVSHKLPQQVGNYYMRCDIPLLEYGAVLITQQGITPRPNGQGVLRLDNDLRFIDLMDRDPWAIVEESRGIKDFIFEASITDELRARIR